MRSLTIRVLIALVTFTAGGARLMKNINQALFLLIFLLGSINLCAQGLKVDVIKFYGPLILEKDLDKKDYINEYARRDFSVVWRDSKNTEFIGFIGDNYQRIRIKILSIVKDKQKPQTYIIGGRSAINNEIKSFRGTFVIKQIKRLTKMRWGVDDEYKNGGIKAQGVVIGEYKLYQDRKLKNSGYFEGALSALWYVNKAGGIKFDDIEYQSDPYRNNQFVGSWTSYHGMKKMKCNWGDYRIPDSGDLDIGAGEFSPNEKYKKNGWGSYSVDQNKVFNWNN